MALRLMALDLIPPLLRRPLATVSLLGMITAIAAGLVFVTQTLLARELGPSDYGLFASSLVTVTMLAPLAGFGLFQFRLKVYGVEGWGAHRWLGPTLRFTAVTTVLALALVVGWALLGARDADTRFTLLVLSPVILGVLAVNIMTNKLRLEDRYRAMAAWQVAIPGSRLLLVAVAIALVPEVSPHVIAIGYGVVALVVTLWAVPQTRALLRGGIELKGFGPRPAAPDVAVAEPGLKELWSQAWAYGVVAMLYPVFFQVCTVLLKYLGSDADAGLYGIAMAIMTAIYLIPTTIYQKYLLAKLHRWAVHDKPRFWMVYRKAGFAMLALGLVVGAGLAAASPWLVPRVFGEAYRPVVAILLVLAACVPIRFLSTAIGSVLLTEDHMRYRVYAIAGATVVVVLLTLVLIPPFKALGAAVATVAGEAALLLGTAYCVRRFVVPGR